MAHGYFFQARQYYEQIDMKCETVLPDEGFDHRAMEVHENGLTLLVMCDPKGKGHNAPHRLHAWCLCGRHIPVGRLGQHAKACERLAEVSVNKFVVRGHYSNR